MSFYTLFEIMLNMVDLTEFEVHLKHYPYALHAVYVFVAAIILINFLIAIMSVTLSHGTKHGDGVFLECIGCFHNNA